MLCIHFSSYYVDFPPNSPENRGTNYKADELRPSRKKITSTKPFFLKVQEFMKLLEIPKDSRDSQSPNSNIYMNRCNLACL